jgi:SAM-dependent methyltransferase
MSPADERKQIVERGYDRAADTFAAWQRQIGDSERLERLNDLLPRLPLQPNVLEIGSGAAVRSTRTLAERGRLVGIDLSAEQIRRARERLPEARFIHGDVMDAEFAEGTFDAVVSFYVLNNLPREELGPLFERIRSWLRPGGFFLASLPAGDTPDWRGEWLGVEMFFSGYEPEVALQLLADAGLELVEDSFETMLEPDFHEDGSIGPGYGEVRWLWVLCRKPSA